MIGRKELECVLNRGSLDINEARNKSGKYPVLRPTLHEYRSTVLLQYKEFGLKVLLIRDLTLCLSKNNCEWWLELDISETERVM
jgi:hypothetical protein